MRTPCAIHRMNHIRPNSGNPHRFQKLPCNNAIVRMNGLEKLRTNPKREDIASDGQGDVAVVCKVDLKLG